MPKAHPKVSRLLPLALISALILSRPAYAPRAQDIDKDRERPTRDEAAQRRAAKAAKEAKKLEAKGEEATYEQVLADPDNLDINYRFALGQVRRGDLKGAAATLERILLIEPGLAKVRLFYAVVLFRLDSLAEAQREFETVQGGALAEADRAEVDNYLREIASRQRRTRLGGRLSLGYQLDSNRNSAPAAGERLFLDSPVALTGSSEMKADTSLLTIAGLDAHHDLGTQAGHEIFAAATYYRADQTAVKTLNLQAISLQGGGVYKTPWADFTPTLLFDHILLAQTTFLRNRGASLRLDRRLSKRANAFAEIRSVYQDYSPTAEVPTATERTGAQIDASVGGDYLIWPTMRLGASLGHTAKHARQSYNTYGRNSLGLNHSWLLGRGRFLLSSLALSYDQYSNPDFSASAKYRRDSTLRAGATLGAPLDFLGRYGRDFVGTLTYEYYHALSTIRNYAYTNNKLALMVTYRWEMGL